MFILNRYHKRDTTHLFCRFNKEGEEATEAPVTEVPLSGKLTSNVPGLFKINIGPDHNLGSAWNKNSELQIKSRAEAQMFKARNLAIARAKAATNSDVA